MYLLALISRNEDWFMTQYASSHHLFLLTLGTFRYLQSQFKHGWAYSSFYQNWSSQNLVQFHHSRWKICGFLFCHIHTTQKCCFWSTSDKVYTSIKKTFANPQRRPKGLKASRYFYIMKIFSIFFNDLITFIWSENHVRFHVYFFSYE